MHVVLSRGALSKTEKRMHCIIHKNVLSKSSKYASIFNSLHFRNMHTPLSWYFQLEIQRLPGNLHFMSRKSILGPTLSSEVRSKYLRKGLAVFSPTLFSGWYMSSETSPQYLSELPYINIIQTLLHEDQNSWVLLPVPLGSTLLRFSGPTDTTHKWCGTSRNCVSPFEFSN
jgi:hypothetical protein